MSKIPFEKAQEEVDGWLDLKQVDEKKRDSYKDSIETLVNGVMAGLLTIDDKGFITHKLKFPTEGDKESTGVTDLKYKPRLKMSSVHAALQGTKPGDAHGMVLAYVSALTGQPKNLIKDLDTEDYSIGQAIAIFFV